MTTEDHEKAMDLLFESYDWRHVEWDDKPADRRDDEQGRRWGLAEDER